MKFITTLLAALGMLAATIGSQACAVLIADEPECPKSLIK